MMVPRRLKMKKRGDFIPFGASKEARAHQAKVKEQGAILACTFWLCYGFASLPGRFSRVHLHIRALVRLSR